MTIYKARRDFYPDLLTSSSDIYDMRWTESEVALDAQNFEMTPEEFIEAFLEEDTGARFWLDVGYSTGYDAPFELKLVGWNTTVWEGTFADAGISEADVEALRAIDKLDEFFQRELGIAPDDWEIG